MNKVTIPKKEYQKLVETKLRFDYLRHIFTRDFFAPPPVKDVKTVIDEFRATGRYSRKFLESLEGGLRRSTYFRS